MAERGSSTQRRASYSDKYATRALSCCGSASGLPSAALFSIRIFRRLRNRFGEFVGYLPRVNHMRRDRRRCSGMKAPHAVAYQAIRCGEALALAQIFYPGFNDKRFGHALF